MPRARRSCAAIVLVALCWVGIGSGIAAHAASKPATPATTSTSPEQWDAQLAPIAHEVERIRGLTFKHPVKVEYLDDATFRRRVAKEDGNLTKAERADLARSQAQLRAVGLIAADANLLDATSAFEQAGVLAYYDPDTKSITVRGTTLGADTKTTVAHELTHALQDQHFDLNKLDRLAHRAHADQTLTALIEGDAVRIEDKYTSGLPSSERTNAASQGLQSFNDELDAQAVPEAVRVFFESPYELGLEMVQVAEQEGGNDAVNKLFADPPRSEVAFLDPNRTTSHETPLRVPAPTLAAGEQRGGPPDVFGAFALYLMLSTTMDPIDALDVAKGWGGDSMVTLTRGDQTCVRATFTGRDAHASTALREALQRWSTNGAHAASTVTTAGPLSTLTACDDDPAATDPGDKLARAEATVALRSSLFLEVLQAGASDAVATCAADGVVHAPSFVALRDAAAVSPGDAPPADVLLPVQKAAARILADCRNGG